MNIFRNAEKLTDTINLITGKDHILGEFIDITDSRYIKSGFDDQGEGYIVEWSELFGFGQNKLNLTLEQLKDPSAITAAADAFAFSMIIKRKFTAIQIGSKKINDIVSPTFEFGQIRGPYYNETTPEEEFDSEDEAIKWAYKEDKYGRWMIVPIIRFEND